MTSSMLIYVTANSCDSPRKRGVRHSSYSIDGVSKEAGGIKGHFTTTHNNRLICFKKADTKLCSTCQHTCCM